MATKKEVEKARAGKNFFPLRQGLAGSSLALSADILLLPYLKNMFNFKKKEKETPQDIGEVLEKLKEIEEENRKIKEELIEIKKREKLYLKKPGVVRFNPFPGEGGNQSFSIALVDQEKNGVVITNFYTKDGNRIYGKPIKSGSSEYALSKEEKKAVQGID